MSYHVCKSMRVDKKAGRVFLTGKDNNLCAVNPKTGKMFLDYREWEWEHGSKIMREQGMTALHEAVALEVIAGNFRFLRGRFRQLATWYGDRVKTDPELLEKVVYWYTSGHPVNETREAWNDRAEAMRKQLWKEFCWYFSHRR